MLRLLDQETPFGGEKRFPVSDRKLRLFACAVARLLESSHPEREAVIEACEQVADGKECQWGSGTTGLIRARQSIQAVWGWVWCATAENISLGLAETLHQMRGNAGSFYRQEEVAALLRDIVGTPFRPVTLPKVPVGSPTAWTPASTTATPSVSQWHACPWLTPQVLSLARAAYEERPGRECEKCEGKKQHWINGGPYESGWEDCGACNGTGRIEDGTLDTLTLCALADALEEAGCGSECCGKCNGSGTYTVQVQNAAMSSANGYGVATTYSEWRGCRHCGGDHDRKGSGRISHPLLAHLRSPGPHVRGCFAIDLILGKE